MKACQECSDRLDDGLLYLNIRCVPTVDQAKAKWKSCPLCSQRAGTHVFLRFPGEFGVADDRITDNNPVGAQSQCQTCRNHEVFVGEQRSCASTDGLSAKNQLMPLLLAEFDNPALSEEGRRKLITHLRAERAPDTRRKVLAARRDSHGQLACDACDVDLAGAYGADKSEVVEVHHKKPVSLGVQTPKVSDFAILCPTCHRVAHHRREFPLTVAEIRRLLAKQRGLSS